MKIFKNEITSDLKPDYTYAKTNIYPFPSAGVGFVIFSFDGKDMFSNNLNNYEKPMHINPYKPGE